jgi:hypothetical protein
VGDGPITAFFGDSAADGASLRLYRGQGDEAKGECAYDGTSYHRHLQKGPSVRRSLQQD